MTYGVIDVYLILFPEDSPLPQMLPEGFAIQGCFHKISEAAIYLTEKRENQAKAHQARDQKGEVIEPAHVGASAGLAAAGMAAAGSSAVGREEIAVINGTAFYRQASPRRGDPDVLLQQELVAFQEALADVALKLLLPEEKNRSQNLLIDLMSHGIYDFWFLSALDSASFGEILSTKRNFRDLDAYLSLLPKPDLLPAEHSSSTWRGKLTSIRSHLSHWQEALLTQPPLRIRKLERAPRQPGDMPTAEQHDWEAALGTRMLSSEEGMSDKYPGADQQSKDGGLPGDPSSDWGTGPDAATAEVGPGVWAAPGSGSGALVSGNTFAEFVGSNLEQSKGGFFFQDPERPSQRHCREKSEGMGRRGRLSPALFLRRHKGAEAGNAQSASSQLGTSLLFYGEEDSLLAYALAILTGLQLAGSGRKTLLLELPGSGLRLAEALGMRHEEKNLQRALQDYAGGKRQGWQTYCFNGQAYCRDDRSFDRTPYLKTLPENLFWLPDCRTDSDLFSCWEGFMGSLVHWAVLEEQFFSLIYVGWGRQGEQWAKGVSCRQKIWAFLPWPAGYNAAYAARQAERKNTLLAFDSSWGEQQIRREIKALGEKNCLMVGPSIKRDFLRICAFCGSWQALAPESLACLDLLWEKINRQAEDK